VVVDRLPEEIVHTGAEIGRAHAQAGRDAREKSRIDPERDPAAATRGQYALGGKRDRAAKRHVCPAVDLGDLELGDVVEARDDLLHPEVAQHELLELKRRAEQRQEALAVDVDGQRLLADDVTLDLLQPAVFDLKVRAHGPIVPCQSGKAKGSRRGPSSLSPG
jgi:hypothetical protein